MFDLYSVNCIYSIYSKKKPFWSSTAHNLLDNYYNVIYIGVSLQWIMARWCAGNIICIAAGIQHVNRNKIT